MTPYNLWILNHYAGNLRHGMEYRHFFLAKHLQRRGNRVGLVASSFSHLFSRPPAISGLVEDGRVDEIPFVWLRSPRYSGNGIGRLANMLVYSILAQLTDLESRIGRPDVILGSSPHPFTLWNALRLANRYDVPCLIEIRDLWPLMLVELGSIGPGHPLAVIFQRLEDDAFQRADRVISLWHSADEYMVAHGVDAERYRYLPNGIELEDEIFEGAHPLLDAVDVAREQGCFTVGYGGSHGHANPLDQVVYACQVLKRRGVDDVVFFMVGNGPEKERVRTRAQELKLSNLRWFDTVEKDVVMAFYRRLDAAFIGLRDLPLFKYGPTPNKLMDYMATGIPIIYAIRSSFDPVSSDNMGLSIPPDDGEALADAIIELRALPSEERESMGRRARRFAETEHSYSALAGRLDDIIREVL